MPMEPQDLPGSRSCVGCGGLTFRNREDGLCPRCAFQAESLIEQIELDGLDHDLNLMSRFEAYCNERDLAAAEPPVAARRPFEHRQQPVDGRRRPFAGREPDFPAASWYEPGGGERRPA